MPALVPWPGNYSQHPRASVSPTAARCTAWASPTAPSSLQTHGQLWAQLLCPHGGQKGKGLGTDRPGVQEAMGAIISLLGRSVWGLLGTAELLLLVAPR